MFQNPIPDQPLRRRRWIVSLSRILVQTGFLALFGYVAVMHQVVGGGPEGAPSIEAFCPLGGLEAFIGFVTSGQIVNRLHMSTMIVFVALALLTVLAGAGFCGWLCPLGTVQEWVGKIGQKVFGRRFTLPAAIDRPLQYGRYLMLAWAVFGTAYYGYLVFRDYDPYLALAHVTALELSAGALVLGLTVVTSLFVERPWCRYFCPLGGFVALTSKISLLSIRRDSAVCIDCSACNKVCPMNIDVAHTSTPSSTCNSCLNCVAACPKAGALALTMPTLKLPLSAHKKEVAADAR